MGTRLKAVIRYDGAPFAGFQVQPGRRTVQGDIEDALSRIASAPVRIQGAARTDAGVHAFGQVFSVDWPAEPDLFRLRKSLNGMLAPDIRVECLETAPPDFNARFNAKGKTYAYTLFLGRVPDPFSGRFAWRVPWPIEPARLEALARPLLGEHDFAGFQCAGASPGPTVRTLHGVEAFAGGAVGPMDAADLWRLEFTGDGFLYKMVRNIVGTLVDVARGHLPESRIAEMLRSPGPFHGHTAPSHGLVLLRVYY